MKCEKCGQEIDCLLVDEFNYDGSDSDKLKPIVECEEDAAYVETTSNWTGYELTEEEARETLRCPRCRKFPFHNQELQVYDIVRVVCFKEGRPC